MLLLEIKT